MNIFEIKETELTPNEWAWMADMGFNIMLDVRLRPDFNTRYEFMMWCRTNFGEYQYDLFWEADHCRVALKTEEQAVLLKMVLA